MWHGKGSKRLRVDGWSLSGMKSMLWSSVHQAELPTSVFCIKFSLPMLRNERSVNQLFGGGGGGVQWCPLLTAAQWRLVRMPSPWWCLVPSVWWCLVVAADTHQSLPVPAAHRWWPLIPSAQCPLVPADCRWQPRPADACPQCLPPMAHWCLVPAGAQQCPPVPSSAH